jgi:PAS domain S-box-containing protein
MTLVCFRCPSLLGQTSAFVNLQVGHDSWTFKDGAPADVTCLAQTNDGFLWLGSQNGLFRFDGARFEPFTSLFGGRLLTSNLYSLFAPPSGGLWVGYVMGGFSFLDKGRLVNYEANSGSVYGFTQDRNGVVWAATAGGLWRFDHSSWQLIGLEWNLPAGAATKVGVDSNGILWALVGTDGGTVDLLYLLPGTKHFETAKRSLIVDGFLLNADRAVITDSATPPISAPHADSAEMAVGYPVLLKGSLQFVDRNNSLWVSYEDKPIVMRIPDETHNYDLKSAIPTGSEVYDFYPYDMAQLVDREGNVWFGDTKGLHRFSYSPLNRQEFPKGAKENQDFALAADDNGVVWISSRTDVPRGDLYYVSNGRAERRSQQVTTSFAYRAPDRTLWFSGKDCLWHLVGHDFTCVNLPPEMAKQYFFLQTIAQDRQGGLWVSYNGNNLNRFADGIWTSYVGRNDLPKKVPLICAFTDNLGRVWFGYAKSQLAMWDGDRFHSFGPNDGIQVGTITAVYGRGPGLWIGGEFGLQQFDQGHFHNIAAVNDEWLRGISGIVETANGDLWLNGISGIFHIPKTEVSAALRDPNYRVKGEHFGRREGVPGIAAQLRPLPTAIEGSDGRLWFTYRNAVVWLDPAGHSEKRAVPLPITIQSVFADDKFYAPDLHLSFPALTSSVQISYNAVSLSDPEAIRFRYKLRETDKDWREAAAANPVTYRNLPPGSYHFSVEASDTNGVWSGLPANMAFTILPAFYQTLWFRLLCAAVLLAFLWWLYRLRVQQLRREEVKLREAIETIPAMAWIAGPDGTVQFMNRRWVDYTGLSQLGTVRAVGIHPEDLDRSVERMNASFANGEPFEDEVRVRRTDGEYRWFLNRGVPLRDKRGKILKWYGAATDIQDRKHAEQLLADLAHINRVSTMGELVASISHELAQPITITTAHAKASLRWLQREPPDLVEVRKGTERILEAGTLASEIINRLRSLYKKSAPKRELVAINEVIGEMVLLLQGEANEDAVSIRADVAADLPKITADRVQLQQVLMNLMLNGIEAMKGASGVLTVKSQLREDGQIQISIHDTGGGLPVGKADQIFDAFFTTKPQGSGMGLAISKSIVESQGGRIWADGDGGRGATFHFILPAVLTGTNPPVDAA